MKELIEEVKNKKLDIETFGEPLEKSYTEEDLLTRRTIINPDWHEGMPEDERYIVTYIDEGYTGFLPVNLKINPPNFVHMWGVENSEGEIALESLPIDENGKFKFLYHSGQMGPFALGYIPIKRFSSQTEDFDFMVQIPPEEKLIELEPGQVIPVRRNKRRLTYTIYDDEMDDDEDIEQTNDVPMDEDIEMQLNKTKLLLKNSEELKNRNDTSYRNIGNFEITVDIPIYEGYTQSNPLIISNNGSGVISIPNNYDGLGEINYEVNVPPIIVTDQINYQDFTKWTYRNLSTSYFSVQSYKYYLLDENHTQIILNSSPFINGTQTRQYILLLFLYIKNNNNKYIINKLKVESNYKPSSTSFTKRYKYDGNSVIVIQAKTVTTIPSTNYKGVTDVWKIGNYIDQLGSGEYDYFYILNNYNSIPFEN